MSNQQQQQQQRRKSQKKQVEEETSILAAIGSSLTAQSTYETEVLRDATLSHVPSLSGIGFPNLESLAPSFGKKSNNSNDNDNGNDNGSHQKRDKSDLEISHMVTIFHRICHQLDDIESSSSSSKKAMEHKSTNILRMKKQILLSYFASFTNLQKEDIEFDSAHETKMELKRNNRLLSLNRNRGEHHYNHARREDFIPKSMMKQQGSTNRIRMDGMDTSRLENIKQNNLIDHEQILYSYTDEENNDKEEEEEEVVEILSKSKNASFGKHAIEAQNQSRRHHLQNKKRVKLKMMNFKKQLIEEQGETWIDPEELYQKRLERKKERRERRNQRRGVSGVIDITGNITTTIGTEINENTPLSQQTVSTSIENTTNINSPRKNIGVRKKKRKKPELSRKKSSKANTGTKRTRSNRINKTLIQPHSNKAMQGNNPDKTSNSNINTSATIDEIAPDPVPIPTPIPIDETPDKQTKTVSCPICNNDSIQVPVEHMNDLDSFLSMHMQSCTGSNKPSLRSSSRRSNLRVRKQVNYKDFDEDDGEIIDSAIDDKKDMSIDVVDSNAHQQAEDSINDDISFSKSNEINESDNDDDFDNDDNNSILENDIDPNDESNEIPSSSTTSLESEYVREIAIDDLDEDYYEDRVDDWIVNGVQKMKKMNEQDANEKKPGAVTFPGGLEVPAWVNDRLFGYQRTALRWMWELHLQGAGGIVGDEMGLGKTVQVCSYLGSLAMSRKMRSVLIIAPATMLMHWLSELAIWAPGLRRILIHKSGEKGKGASNRSISRNLLRRLDKWLTKSRSERLYEHIDEKDLCETDPNSFVGTGVAVLTTFEGIRRSVDKWVGFDWSYVVMDEGQKIRNPDADVTIACKRLRTTNRLLLSGTPIQNDLRELWSLFDFVFPGRLGLLPTFLTEFADPIKRGGYSNASPMQVQLAYRCALVLRDLINPYLLRRQKKEIKEVSRMPGKTEQVLFCKLSLRQRRMYEAYLQSDEVQNVLRNRGTSSSFKPIITMRKICNHPQLIVGSDPASYDSFLKNGCIDQMAMEDYSSDEESTIDDFSEEESIINSSGKLEVLAKILPLWKKQGHRVLIFSQWKKTLNIIQQFTNMKGWNFERMDGNTNVEGRQKMVDRFNNDDRIFGMLLTTKTGGVGLNLIGANRVVLFDPDWNPQSDAQARERAWRFGQKNPVTVYRLITAGTIEEKIYQRQIFKTAITNQVLQDPRQRRMFSQKDLRDLFTLKPDANDVRNGDGITETGELTKGRGVIHVDDVGDANDETIGHACAGEVVEAPNDSRDNKDTIDEIMKSKGLAGIFDHDFVDNPSSKKSFTMHEMEQQAKNAAARAAKILTESSSESKAFIPTWTGSEATNHQRFGGVTKNSMNRTPHSSSKTASYDHSFGGAKSVGLNQSIAPGVSSSSSLLAQVRQRRQEVATIGEIKASSYDDKKHARLLKRIRDFMLQYHETIGGGPPTNEILKEFMGEKIDPIIFKSMLRKLAVLSNGEWNLKSL